MSILPSQKISIALLSCAITLLVYLPALTCGFINLDDPAYVVNNPGIRQWGAGLFAQVLPGSWTPLTLISFAVDYRLWGVNPLGYHLTNIVLHAANAGMVASIALLLFTRLPGLGNATGGTEEGVARDSVPFLPFLALLAGLLWGVHPLRVESVAWVSARKDVLNGALTLGSVLFYLRYVLTSANDSPGVAPRRYYLLSLFLFLLSLLAKQMSVTLPLVLLLIDWCPLRRLHRGNIGRVVREKVPYLAIAAAITVITVMLAQQAQQFTDASQLPMLLRCLVSGNAVFEYCRLLLYPVDIIPYYVLAKEIPYAFAYKSAFVLLLTACCIGLYRRQPAAPVVWLAFVVPLTPVLAFLHSGDDLALAVRYTYLPAVAPSIAVAWGMCRGFGWLARHRRGRWLMGAGAMLVAALLITYSVTTVRLIKVWENTATFWTRVIKVQPLGRAYSERGLFNLIQGRPAEALADLSLAITIAEQSQMPLRYNLYAFRGVALSDLGRHAEAVDDFSAAIALLPHPTYYQYRGRALQALGRLPEAAADLRLAGPNPPPIDRFWLKKQDLPVQP